MIPLTYEELEIPSVHSHYFVLIPASPYLFLQKDQPYRDPNLPFGDPAVGPRPRFTAQTPLMSVQ